MARKHEKKSEERLVAEIAATEKTSRGLRNTLFEQIDKVRTGEVSPTTARAVSSLAAQILNSVKLEIEMHRYASNMARPKTDETVTSVPEISL